MDGVRYQQSLSRAGHAGHAITFFILLATGVLLFSPTIRSRVVGGYSLSVRLIHCWTGIAFVLVTWPAVRYPFQLARSGSAQGTGSAEGWLRHWRRAHLLFTLGAAAAFTATGLVLWQRGRFTLELMDASAAVHLWLTYVAAGVFVAHLSVAAITLRALRERAVGDASTRNAGMPP